MKVSDVLAKSISLNSRVLPSFVELDKAVGRILHRWPDAVKEPEDRDRERLAQEMRRRIETWDWGGLKTSRVASAAVAVFDEERREREDLADVREFYYEELRQSSQTSFLTSMLWVYVGSFDPKSEATASLGAVLRHRRDDFDERARRLISALPDLLDPASAVTNLASVMYESDDPFGKLKSLGIRAPHGPGLTRHAHVEFVRKIGPHLKRADEREQLLRWLVPQGGNALEAGAGLAVEALLRVWVNETPSDAVRSDLSEAIISAYNDPRTHSGGIWSGFDPDLRAVLLRWLTKEDMLFFCDMVTATQGSHMWPLRRDFWLRLYEDGRIDEAWVAFGRDALHYAKRRLSRSDTTNLNRRFGRQLDRGGSTSLLIMRIGNKIVVDGCHNYRTHIFNRDDPKAPKLYGSQYYCDDIMRYSRNAKSHSSIPVWRDWVMRHV
ncbi:EH signature domain-containing protein [Defluviimonas sp. WL0002]|uniref:EH signature domain-containing protein n=1 Tax=Albidovulum marisflavi TaxID=2984159 RepID=A0ABT2ZH69_9RHOB|nr:EH signature domain-containing protein [Defluviimonas sp. WL0002]MCV2870393.1 EH signature domain-containing protein [Defluviimonas sp. WL0002]